MNSQAAVRQGQDATFVRRAFAAIAPRYVLTNHVLSLGVDLFWRWLTARDVARRSPQFVLDLATGSGDLAEAIRSRCPSATVLAADFSIPMLEEARRRGVKHLLAGDGLQLPIAEESMDVVTVAFGLRNMASWPSAAREMCRVLRNGGTLFVLDFSLPQNHFMKWFYLIYLRKIMPLVAGILTGQRHAYEYLCSSIESFPSGQNMCRLLQECGFSVATARPLSLGVATLYIAVK